MATTTKKAEATPEVAAPATPDPYERVEVFIPRAANGEKTMYVGINDYTALLPRGKTSMVPRFVKEFIEDCFAAEEEFQNGKERQMI